MARIIASSAWLMALGAGLVLTSAVPALAKKAKGPEGTGVSMRKDWLLSKPFRSAAAAIEADLARGAGDAAAQKIPALKSIAEGADAKYLVGAYQSRIGTLRRDLAMQFEGAAGMAASGAAPSDAMLELHIQAGSLAHTMRSWRNVVYHLDEAVRRGLKDPDVLVALSDAQFQLGQTGEGGKALAAAVAAKDAAAQPVPVSWFERAQAYAYKSKAPSEFARWGAAQLSRQADTPNWRAVIVNYRDLAKPDNAATLDLYRLLRITNALGGEADLRDYADLAIKGQAAAEAKTALDAGVASGALNKTARPVVDLLASAKAKSVGAAALVAAEKAASGKGDGKASASAADSHLGAGQDAKAASLYRQALQKGQVDADAVNMRLGIALARQGLKDEARKALASVAGARGDVARFWLAWVDSQR